MHFLIFALLYFSQSVISAPSAKAIVLEMDDPSRTVLYNLERKTLPPLSPDLEHYQTEFRTPAHALFFEEDVIQKGAEFKSYRIKLPLLNESADIQVRDGKVHLQYQIGDKKQTAVEDWSPEYVVAPTLVAYLQKHWGALQNGEAIRVRMIVPERVESFGFKFVKDGQELYEGKAADRILFKPTSFFISLIVKPIKFLIDSTTLQPLKISGRTVLKKKTASGWEDFQADTVFLK